MGPVECKSASGGAIKVQSTDQESNAELSIQYSSATTRLVKLQVEPRDVAHEGAGGPRSAQRCQLAGRQVAAQRHVNAHHLPGCQADQGDLQI